MYNYFGTTLKPDVYADFLFQVLIIALLHNSLARDVFHVDSRAS